MPQYARALYAFRGAQDGDLSFQEDDILVILSRDESGWWTGEHCGDGRRGEFPYNYVETISEDEAMRAQKSLNKGGVRNNAGGGLQGDRVASVRVTGSDYNSRKLLMFRIEAVMASGRSKKAKRSLCQIREFDRLVRKIFPSFERVLPPSWADAARLGPLDVDKRERTIESYLVKMMGNDTADYFLLSWLLPGERADYVGASQDVLEIAGRMKKLGEDRDFTIPVDRIPQLANVEFTWTPQDDVELYMQEGQIIEIVTQETGSPGWWNGRTVDGMTGLLPYNHVEVLDERVSAAVINGTSLSKAQAGQVEGFQLRKSGKRSSMNRISLGLFGNKAKGPASQVGGQPRQRQRKVVYPFTISSCESFDRLIDNGFTMEENGQVLSMTPPRDAPKDGDFVQLSYCAYVWDCQKQSILEFAASDNPSKLAEAGPMEFFVGKGEVIKGIDYAVLRMRQGQSVRLIVTPQLAYGAVGLPPDVPPHAHVVYDLTLEAFGTDSGDAGAGDDVPPPPSDNASAVSSRSPYGRKNSIASSAFTESSMQSHKPPKPQTPKAGKPRHERGDRDRRDRGDRDRRDRERRDRGDRGDRDRDRQTRVPASSRMPQGGTPRAAPPSSSASAFSAATGASKNGFRPPKGKDMSLADAIAMRRQKLDTGSAGGGAAGIMRPVQERPRNERRPNNGGFAGRERVEVSRETSPPPQRQQRAPPRQEYSAAQKSFTLQQLQDAVRDKRLRQLGIDPAAIEDYLTDDEFEMAFQMSRTDFLLKPRWRQQALKRGVRLF